MRLATAADEIEPLNDPRVQENTSYLTILLLSRVVTQLGSMGDVTPEDIESLFVSDLEHLQGLYERINDGRTDFEDLQIRPDERNSQDDGDLETVEETEMGNE